MTIQDTEFLNQFEAHTLDPSYFDHHGHLRLAWLYLNKYQSEVAISKVTTGISGYAASLGVTNKFQHTLTEAIVRIMALRLDEDTSDTIECFLESNYDLVEDIWGVVGSYYSKEQLNSDVAKIQFVEPDLRPIS
jgi:hypothetical protein